MAYHSHSDKQVRNRLKLAVLFLLLLVMTGAGTVFALTIHHSLTSHPAVAVETKPTSKTKTTAPTSKPAATQTTTSEKKAAPATTSPAPAPVATTPAPAPTPAPTPAPAPVVAPSPSGEVPTLQPTSTSTSTSSSSTSTSSSSSSSTQTPTQTTVSYKSTNWSGYMASGGTFTAVSGAWVVPSPTSTSTTADSYDAAWVGIGGVTSSDLIQTGTANVVATDGSVSTMAFYELLPAAAQNIVSMVVTPGDTMSASITQTSAGQWSLIITDVTTGKSFSKALAYSSQLSSAEWIEEAPTLSDGSIAPLDNFGTVHFSNGTTTMDGSSLSIAAANAASITMVDKNNKAIAVPSAVSGGMFSVQYQ